MSDSSPNSTTAKTPATKPEDTSGDVDNTANAEAEKIAADKIAEADKIAADKIAEADKIAADKVAEADKIAADKVAEADKIAADKTAEADKIAADKVDEEAAAETQTQPAPPPHPGPKTPVDGQNVLILVPNVWMGNCRFLQHDITVLTKKDADFLVKRKQARKTNDPVNVEVDYSVRPARRIELEAGDE